MVALIDTNIIIDYLVNREPFSNDAEKIIELCKDGQDLLRISPLWIVFIYYVKYVHQIC